jgi:hypothetical protein
MCHLDFFALAELNSANPSAQSQPIQVLVKSLAGDVLSLDCSPDDTLLHLKRQIAAAAATQLGLEWPACLQQLFRLSNCSDQVEDGASVNAAEDDLDVKQDDDGVFRGDSDSKSLQSLRIGHGDMLGLLFEEQVRSIQAKFIFILFCLPLFTLRIVMVEPPSLFQFFI